MTVAESKQRDIGKKRARIGPDAMDYLNVSPGDIIRIIGKRVTCAIVWPADEDEKYPDTIRVDGQTRKNLGVSLNDIVEIEKTDVKQAKNIVLVPINDVITVDKKLRITYEQVGGLREEIKVMREIVELPLRHPELFSRLGVEPHSGILLYGPPGCGKTLLAKVLASESEATMYSINGPEIMNKYYGETEARLRDIFKEAKEKSPSIIFIDEIDAIAPKREEAYGDVEKRVVAQLLALMDGLTDRGNVIVLGATNRPDSVDPALRRPGRFDREIEISVPNADGRFDILQIHTRGMPNASDVDLKILSSELHGYTGADIKSLCREAAMKTIRRYLPEIDLETEKIPVKVLESMDVKLVDYYNAMHEVIPTAMREFYVERSKVFWNDVGGLNDVKRILEDNLIVAMNEPKKFLDMGISPPKGALLYGPPGCGKTLLARALATESGGNMIIVRGPEILSKWVGESEKAIREIFRKAKASSPCVIVFDELDSLAKLKSGDERSVGETVLSQLLTEMEDGTTSRVVIIGITNRPDLIENSMLRNGRLDLPIYIPPPDENGRHEIIKILTEMMPLHKDVNLKEIAISTQSYTGADLASLCREAAVEAMQNNSKEITNTDFAAGLKRVKPSITQEVEQWYDKIQEVVSNVVPKEHDRTFYG